MHALSLAALAWLALPQESQEAPNAGFALQVPDGWDRRDEHGTRVLTPKDVGADKFHVVMIPPLTKKLGSLKALVDAGKATLGEMGTFKPHKDPVRAKNDAGWEYDIATGTLEKDGLALVAQIVALQKGKEEGLVLLVCDSVATYEKHADPFIGMIRSLGAAKGSKGEIRYDVWRFPAPEGWTKSETADAVGLTRIDGAEFCQFAVYKSRPPGPGSVDMEVDREWKQVLCTTLTSEAMKKLPDRRLKSGVVAQRASADTRDPKGAAYHSVLHVLAPYGRVTSVIVNTNTAATFAKYEKAVTDLLDSMTIDVDPIAKAAAEAAGKVGKPAEALGKWAFSKSGNFDPYAIGLHHGSSRGQYDFRGDGTYTFHLEAWGGSYRSDEYFIIDESGKFVVEGNKLTVSPESGTTVVKNRAGDILKKLDPALQKTTYLWQLHYFEGIRDNELVLTPPGMTAREGLFASNALFSRSYLLSTTYNPEWTKFGK